MRRFDMDGGTCGDDFDDDCEMAGDWRTVCGIEDDVLVILTVDVAHEGDVYRRARR